MKKIIKMGIISLLIVGCTFAASSRNAYCNSLETVKVNGVDYPVLVIGDTASMSPEQRHAKAVEVYNQANIMTNQTALWNQYTTTHRTDLPYDQNIIAQQSLATNQFYINTELSNLMKDTAAPIDSLIQYYNRMYMEAAKTGDSFLQSYYLMAARDAEANKKNLSQGKEPYVNWNTRISDLTPTIPPTVQ